MATSDSLKRCVKEAIEDERQRVKKLRRDHPNVKRIAKLTKRDSARSEGVIYLEGTRLCEEALLSGQTPLEVIVSEDRINWAEEFAQGIEPLVLSKDVFKKISQTVNPQGVALIIKEPSLSSDIPQKADGKDIYVVLENTQDPGNLGTMIRTAEAAGFDFVLASEGTVDIYNPKVIRSTMGSVFRVPITYTRELKKAADELKGVGVKLYAAHLKGKHDYNRISYGRRYAIMIGNEANGLSDEASEMADELIRIPMHGQVESLNAAVAAALLMYSLL